MAMPFLNFPEKPLNFEKLQKKPKNNSNLKSFWAFVFSIFIYTSIFYIFNLSPSTLFCTTKFWFFISNTLILIIAADFGAFSSSKEHDLYEEYVIKNKNAPSFDPQYVKMVEKTTINELKAEEEEVDENPHEKTLHMVVATSTDDHKNRQIKKYKPMREEDDDGPAEKPNGKSDKKKQELMIVSIPEDGKRVRGQKKGCKAKCVRCDSDKSIITAAAAEDTEEKLVLQRTFSERHEELRLEENEFSRMSDEELNRRVEEFIRRFNRQIRLQNLEMRPV